MRIVSRVVESEMLLSSESPFFFPDVAHLLQEDRRFANASCCECPCVSFLTLGLFDSRASETVMCFVRMTVAVLPLFRKSVFQACVSRCLSRKPRDRWLRVQLSLSLFTKRWKPAPL